VKRTE